MNLSSRPGFQPAPLTLARPQESVYRDWEVLEQKKLPQGLEDTWRSGGGISKHEVAGECCQKVMLSERSRKKTIPDIYICNLAVADLVHIVGMPFLIHQWARGGEWVFGGPLCTIITSLDTCNQFACSAIMTVMSVDRYLALVQPFRLTSWRTRYKTIRINLGLWAASFILALPVWLYSKVITFEDGVESCAFDLASPDDVLRYNPCVPRQRVTKLTKMVLVLVAVFVLSAAPYHVIQLVNLQMQQPTLAFYVTYYLSICLSYASSSINPFLYILLSGNFQKRLPGLRRRVIERESHNMENTLKSSF
ncbi:Melanin-concentrating hormone receptor 2 [Myotis brandtii]|uniref:Melanin-concentrating hormone receptor 2 n=1 Tax=Myotis brandtii TaxID=109478 RepID=S7NM25_MYOBR|nr:Melanin-concentrating hormone receptor 2 [Myotis brandtii]